MCKGSREWLPSVRGEPGGAGRCVRGARKQCRRVWTGAGTGEAVEEDSRAAQLTGWPAGALQAHVVSRVQMWVGSFQCTGNLARAVWPMVSARGQQEAVCGWHASIASVRQSVGG